MILLQVPGGAGNYSFIFLMVGMFVVMYFFMIRPQQKKQKDQKKMVDALQTGDEVVTTSGMHGKIASLTDETITISAGGGARLTFDKASVSRKK
ncbi:MAG: preprotein translocase subunit YajC [Spirosomataceae bacterium]|jgi:preprotein translocase subunit YajC